MKNLTLTLTLVLSAMVVYAQQGSRLSIDDQAFEEKLVQLAWQNSPSIQIAKTSSTIASYEAKAVAQQWSNNVGLTGNLNEFNIRDLASNNNDGGNLFFPRYNVYVRVPLSVFLESPKQTKAARARETLARQRENQAKVELRAKVLRLYSDYKSAVSVHNMLKESSTEIKVNFELQAKGFQEGKIPLNQYLTVLQQFNDHKIQVLRAENDVTKAKLSLEEVIGVILEDIQ